MTAITDHDRLHPLRPFLKNWVWEHGHIGTRYLDCADGEVKFDEGKKSRFAAEDYFYVSLDRKIDTAADATTPTLHDAGLARFLRAAQLGKPEEAGPMADVQRAVQDCVELGLFSAYQGEAKKARARYEQEPMFEDEIRAAMAEDIRRGYVGMREQLALYDFTVLYGLPAPLVFSEAPFIDWRVRTSPALPFVSLPLGPYCLLVGAPSGRQSRIGPVTWKSAVTLGPLKDHNRQLADHAQLWLVATTDDQLAAVQSRRFPKPEEPKA